MTRRAVVTLHLPMEMGAAGRILQAVSREFPGAVVDQSTPDGSWQIVAEADPHLQPDQPSEEASDATEA